MQVLIADQEQVAQLFPMTEALEIMAEALRLLETGEAVLPLRSILHLPDGSGLMGLMPSYLGGIQSLGVKVITVFPDNHGTEFDAHQGVVLLFDAGRGLLRAIIDATSITAIRTAAVSGVATRLLAREDAGDLVIIGAGTQARTHLEAMLLVRPIHRVRVFSRSLERAREFACRESKRHGIEIEVTGTAQETVAGAGIICTVTNASEPVLQGEWLAPGAHINAVGACLPTMRELDTQAVLRSRLYVDRRESTLNEAGDFLIPKEEGVIGDDHIVGELGQILTGHIPARIHPGEITLFKSLGIAIEDLAAAHHILQKAEGAGVGTWVEIGGRHYATA
jgi:ornithine cyclodeaminase